MFVDRNALGDIAREIKNLAPVLGKQNSERLERAYLLGDEETRKRILFVIDALKATTFSDEEMKNSLLLEPPKSSVAGNGNLNIGSVLYGRKRLYPFNIDLQMLLTHVAIFGSSGYGKTNIVHHFIQGLAEENIPVLVFDFSKRNYRDLATLPTIRNKIKIYTPGRSVSPFHFNPLLPPDGVPISEWAKEFAEVFDHAYWLLGGGKHVVLKALGEIYDKAVRTPRIRDLKLWADMYSANKSISARERNWVATAQRPIDSLCFRGTKEIFEKQEGRRPSEFFAKDDITILELDALTSNDRTFFIEIILQWIRDWLLVSGSREKLRGVIVLEEAHHMVNREKSSKLGSETVVDLIFREIRELGIGILFTDQHPSLISYPALGNTSTQIYMNLGLDAKHSSDILDSSNMLGLDYEREGRNIRKLPVGHGIVLSRRIEFKDPFVVEFPLVPIKKGTVTDEMVKEMMDVDEEDLPEEKTIPKPGEVRKTEETKPKYDMSGREWEIIGTIGRGLGATASEISRNIGVSGTAFREFSKKMIEDGFVGTRNVKVSRQETRLFYLTDKGGEAFIQTFREERIPQKEEINIEPVIQKFVMDGYSATEKNGDLIISKKGKTERAKIVSDPAEDISGFLDDDSKAHIFFSSNLVKNACIQIFSELFKERAVIYTLTAREALEGRGFKRIEFS